MTRNAAGYAGVGASSTETFTPTATLTSAMASYLGPLAAAAGTGAWLTGPAVRSQPGRRPRRRG